jgi:hypothetical protein
MEVGMSVVSSGSFCCRVCGYTQYSPVRTREPSGAWIGTGYWKCMGCSVMFTDPKAFSTVRKSEDIVALQSEKSG